MKASILTFSQTGNTLKVGHAIANGLQNNGLEVEHVRFLHRRRWKPDQAELIGIGCPCFENHPAECVPEFLKNGGFDFAGKKAFVFITAEGSPAKSLWRLAQAVTRTGATVIGGVQLRGACTVPTMFGFFTGRPNERDLAYAEAFGRAIAANIIDGEALPAQYKVDPNHGGRFYDLIGPCLTYLKKKITPLPRSDLDRCDLCGNCVYECPTGSIKIENKTVKFHNTCIVCYRCWHVCPHNAISIKFSPANGLIERSLYSEKMERLFGNIEPDEDRGPNLYEEALARRIKLKYDRKNPTAEYEPIE